MSVAEMRTRARLGKFAVEHAHSLEDDELPPLSIRVVRVEDQEDLIEFEVIGIDPPIANAFRRIMIAEVPSMAIEHVNLYQNTSIIQDEVLVHRLGLIPINADPRKFKFLQEIEGRHTSETTLVFTLHVSCEEGKNPPSVLADARGREVWSKDLKWIPQGPQRKIFKSNPVAPIHDDILIARLRPGQEIEAELFVEKGIGREHAKWSPVCTASYRLMPDIQLLKKVSFLRRFQSEVFLFRLKEKKLLIWLRVVQWEYLILKMALLWLRALEAVLLAENVFGNLEMKNLSKS
jgi:DNA-directed RNA polymerase alpha subunit